MKPADKLSRFQLSLFEFLLWAIALVSLTAIVVDNRVASSAAQVEDSPMPTRPVIVLPPTATPEVIVETSTVYVEIPVACDSADDLECLDEFGRLRPTPQWVWDNWPNYDTYPKSRKELYTLEEYRALLTETSWPNHRHEALVNIASCEAPFVDWKGDFGEVGQFYIYSKSVGDSGRAFGILQIRIDVHATLFRAFDMWNPIDNLNAGYIIFLQGGYQPWSCSSAYVGPR